MLVPTGTGVDKGQYRFGRNATFLVEPTFPIAPDICCACSSRWTLISPDIKVTWKAYWCRISIAIPEPQVPLPMQCGVGSTFHPVMLIALVVAVVFLQVGLFGAWAFNPDNGEVLSSEPLWMLFGSLAYVGALALPLVALFALGRLIRSVARRA